MDYLQWTDQPVEPRLHRRDRPYRWIVSLVGGLAMAAIGLALITGAWAGWANWLRAVAGRGLNI